MPNIVLEREGNVAWISINRPHVMNAMDLQTMLDFHAALVEFRDDASLDVGVLRGEGDLAFCAGTDIKEEIAQSASFARSYFQPFEQSIREGFYPRALSLDAAQLHKPVIAAVNGQALGGGLEIALSCDLRIGSTNAAFGLPEARWATVPAVGGISRLLRAVPEAIAQKMLLTGAPIDASEAFRVGLISDLTAPSDLDDTALKLAHQIAGNGPLAVRAIKETARRVRNLPLSEALGLEEVMWGVLRDTEDRREGRQAFAEKRQPHFTGN